MLAFSIMVKPRLRMVTYAAGNYLVKFTLFRPGLTSNLGHLGLVGRLYGDCMVTVWCTISWLLNQIIGQNQFTLQRCQDLEK